MIKDEPEGLDRKAEVHKVSLGVPMPGAGTGIALWGWMGARAVCVYVWRRSGNKEKELAG